MGRYVTPLIYVPDSFLVKNEEEWYEFIRMVESLNWFFALSLVLYILAISLGQYLMSKREKGFSLKKWLIAWNFAMFLFSFVGVIAMLPPALQKPIGFDAICTRWCYKEGYSWGALMGLLFGISKVFEFQDTFFLVLRKRRVIFLHWFHHIVTMVYCWFWLLKGHEYNCSGLYLAIMNFAIHTVMYFYYFLRAAGINPGIDVYITVSQIIQMVIGIVILATTAYCERVSMSALWYGILMYGAFFLLFFYFFVMRYLDSGKKKKE